ncbi:flavoprotein [Nocardia sp. NBC_01327]|uniref:flavoprotein n=1 Tax=Nocardia sp. NBC_01327 TaxID=2903593 RepID=UPI002E0FAB5F|nr:flavoprotein [Nocardia sp. NBC_01327]
MNDQGNPVLYAIVTGSSRASEISALVELAQADGWDVCVIASPSGARFIDSDALASMTGWPVRSTYKDPGTPDLLPPADAMIVAPLTCNSAAKWSVGISDTLPLGLLIEAVGSEKPVVAVPYSNEDQLNFPPIKDALRKLAECGVGVIAAKPGTPLPLPEAWQALLDHPWLV